MTRQDYDNLPQINQSKLKKLLKSGIESINSREDSTGFALGTLMDQMLTNRECVYRVGNTPGIGTKLYGKAGTVAEVTMQLASEGYGGTRQYSIETIRRKVEEYEDYFLSNAQGIPTITLAEEIELLEAVRKAKSHWLYKDGLHAQVLVTDLLKAELDQITIYEDKILVVDFKRTSFPPVLFDYSIGKFDYPFQAAFYVDLVKTLYSGYKVDFFWLACNHFDAVAWKLSEEDYQRGKASYTKALDLYNWHLENNVWTNKDVYEKGYIESGKIRYQNNTGLYLPESEFEEPEI